MGGTKADRATGIGLDADGNVYTTGHFKGTGYFNPASTTTGVLSSAGSTDVFVSKLSPTGGFVWAKRMGGTGADQGRGLVVGADGSVFTTGSFSGTADFDPSAGGTAELTSAGGTDLFVSRLDAAGAHVAARRVGGAGTDRGTAIARSSDDNVYLAGGFTGTVQVDTGAGTFSLSSAGVTDLDLLAAKMTFG
jgi:hypothetical protein